MKNLLTQNWRNLVRTVLWCPWEAIRFRWHLTLSFDLRPWELLSYFALFCCRCHQEQQRAGFCCPNTQRWICVLIYVTGEIRRFVRWAWPRSIQYGQCLVNGEQGQLFTSLSVNWYADIIGGVGAVAFFRGRAKKSRIPVNPFDFSKSKTKTEKNLNLNKIKERKIGSNDRYLIKLILNWIQKLKSLL